MRWKEINEAALRAGKHYFRTFTQLHTIPPGELEDRDLTILRWLVEKHPEESEQDLIVEIYLKLPNNYLKENGHPVWMMKNFYNAIAAEIKNKREKKRFFTGTNRTMEKLACDSCWKSIKVIYERDVDWTKTWIRCSDCLLANTPFKYPTVEEFRKNWETLGKEMDYNRCFKKKDPYPPHMKNLDYELG